MSKIIFRKLGGRIIPIRVDRIVKSNPHNPVSKEITYKLTDAVTKNRIGEFWARQWWQKPHRFSVGSHLNPAARRYGLGTEFYKKLGAIAKKFGGRSFVGSTDNVEIIGKVRAKLGKTRKIIRPGPYGGTEFVTLLRKKK